MGGIFGGSGFLGLGSGGDERIAAENERRDREAARLAKIERDRIEAGREKFATDRNISIYGTEKERDGEIAGRKTAENYYGNSRQLGQDAQDYRGRIKDKVGEKSALAGRLTQVANQDISRSNAKAGLKGVDTTAASIRERRNSIAKSDEMQQGYDQTNLQNYGKSIGAGISGTEAMAAAGAGKALAATPNPTPSYGGGGMFGSIICTELYNQKKLTLKELSGCSKFGQEVDDNTYSGYLFIATPIVALMKRSNMFSNIFINWAKALSKGKPNRFTKIMIPVCFAIGSLRGVENVRRA